MGPPPVGSLRMFVSTSSSCPPFDSKKLLRPRKLSKPGFGGKPSCDRNGQKHCVCDLFFLFCDAAAADAADADEADAADPPRREQRAAVTFSFGDAADADDADADDAAGAADADAADATDADGRR